MPLGENILDRSMFTGSLPGVNPMQPGSVATDTAAQPIEPPQTIGGIQYPVPQGMTHWVRMVKEVGEDSLIKLRETLPPQDPRMSIVAAELAHRASKRSEPPELGQRRGPFRFATDEDLREQVIELGQQPPARPGTQPPARPGTQRPVAGTQRAARSGTQRSVAAQPLSVEGGLQGGEIGSQEATIITDSEIDPRDIGTRVPSETKPSPGEIDPTDFFDQNVATLTNAADNAANVAVTEGKVTPEAANAAKVQGKDVLEALKGGDDDTDFKALIKALTGPNSITTNAQAKKLLDIDEDESDVPEWAAPMFLFGLNLMQGPVSSKTQGQGLLGGLLSDIGAAGEKGFTAFAAERARKKKEKAQIASLTLQLRTAGAAERKLILNAYKSKKTYDLNLGSKVGSSYDKLMNRVTSLVPDDQAEKKVIGLNAVGTALTQLRSAGVTGEALLKPSVQSFITTNAANQMGITKTPMKLSNQEFGGIKYAWDPEALETARGQFNKADPDKKIPTTVGFLSKLIAKDPSVQKYQDLLIGSRAVNTTSTTTPAFIDATSGNKVVSEILTNTTKRDEWFAANPDATETEIKAAQGTWRFETERRLASAPNFSEKTFTAENGEKISYYMNDAAFWARHNSDQTLTMDKVFKNPEKYPKIIQGKVIDYAGLQPNLSTILVYDKGIKRQFQIDKRAYATALEEEKIKTTDSIQTLIEKGLGRWFGEGVPTKDNEEITIMRMVDGKPELTQIKAGDAESVQAAFVNKADEIKFRGAGTRLLSQNTMFWEIDKILEDKGLSVSSKLTDFLGSATAVVDIVRNRLGVSTGKARAALFDRDLSEDTRAQVASAFGENTWAKLIEDKAQRGELKSMFINLAFALASKREGGKLTDNDVKLALQTLGWEGDSWTQRPGEIQARMKRAAESSNQDYILEALDRMNPDEREAYLKTQDKGDPDMVEVFIRDRVRALNKGVLYDRMKKGLSLRYDGKKLSERGSSSSPFIPVDQSFESGVPENNLGGFAGTMVKTRIPNELRAIHNEVLFPDKKYFPIQSSKELADRIKSPEIAKKLRGLGMEPEDVKNLVNKYLEFFSTNRALLRAPVN
jgi:hypothetical protein